MAAGEKRLGTGEWLSAVLEGTALMLVKVW